MKKILFSLALATVLVGACSSSQQQGTGYGGGGGGGAGGSAGGGGAGGAGGAGGSGGAGGAGGGGGSGGGGAQAGGGGQSAGGGGGGAGGSGGGAGVDAWTVQPLTCSGPGNYNQSNGSSSSCGAQWWDIKTGTDSQAGSISMTPTETTLQQLSTTTGPTSRGDSRISPTETTLFALRDVNLYYLRLESDSDYHLVLDWFGKQIIAEIPYPGCVDPSSPWGCNISRARAVIDANFQVSTTSLEPTGVFVSVIGVGFFDDEHGQFGSMQLNSSYSLELHAVLAICVGKGCDPFSS
jgi:hypothetical protein